MDNSLAISEDTCQQSPIGKVLWNDLLLELILENAIHFATQGFGSTGNSNTANFRLVNKKWYTTISKLYHRHKNHLYHLRLTQDNVSGALVPINAGVEWRSTDVALQMVHSFADLLQKFTSFMTYWELEKPPPFHLELSPTFFSIANEFSYQSILNFLFEYGSDSMVSFSFNFQGCQIDHHAPIDYPNFNLAGLKYLELRIERVAWSFIPFIQKLLECSPNLEVLEFTSSSYLVTFNVNHLAEAIAAIANRRPAILSLPSNIRKVLIYSTTDSCSCFYVIPFANLPKLETLSISASTCIYRLVDEIFDSVAGQLVHLNLISYRSCSYMFGPDFQIVFPRFPRLNSLTVTVPWVPVLSFKFKFETHLPFLEELILMHCSDRHILSFMVGQRSFTVKKLTIITLLSHATAGNLVANGDEYVLGGLRWGSTRSFLIEPIIPAFPNLTHLGIGVSTCVTAGLEIILKEMGNLKSLALYVEANYNFPMVVNFDSIFVGLSPEVCQSLKDAPEYWDSVKMIEDGSKSISIRSLTNLQSLYLVECTYPACPGFRANADGLSDAMTNVGTNHDVCDFKTDTLPANRNYLFSELSFYFSFLKMNKLKYLSFTKGFMVCNVNVFEIVLYIGKAGDPRWEQSFIIIKWSFLQPPKAVQEKWLKDKSTSIRQLKAPKTIDMLTARFSLFDESWYYH